MLAEKDVDSLQAKLSQGLSELKLAISLQQEQQLIAYLQLLEKWNRSFNLTAIRELPKMVTHHLLDSLSIWPYIKSQYILDIGTGAGLPGIPLAICLPQKKFTLLDSNGKKTRFLLQAMTSLQLDNIEIVKSRIEEYHPERSFDTVVTRAFSDIGDILLKTAHVVDAAGNILLMKGRYPEDEIDAIKSHNISIREIVALKVPGLDADRHLVSLVKNP